MKRIGFILSDKKVKRLGFETDVKDYFWRNGIDLVRIDLSYSLEEQGPFDLIIHKTSEFVVKADFGSVRAQDGMRMFVKYVRDHPEIPVMDRLDKVEALLNRTKVYKLVQDCQFPGEDRVFTPNFVEFTSSDVETNKRLLHYANVCYPFVVKHTLAQSADIAHKMALVFNENGLNDITPPCVAQSFINHDASLHKVFVLREECFIVDRPSIKNLYPGDQETIFFDSQAISKTDSSCSLNRLDILDLKNTKTYETDHEILCSIAKTIRQKLDLDLIGIDVIIDNQTGRYAIIDINSFPGYEGVEDFEHTLLTQLLLVMEGSRKAAVSVASSFAADMVELDQTSLAQHKPRHVTPKFCPHCEASNQVNMSFILDERGSCVNECHYCHQAL